MAITSPQGYAYPMPAIALPGEIRVAGADVEVVRNEPLAAGADADAALDADDGIPVLFCDRAAPHPEGSRERSDVHVEIVGEKGLQPEHARAREDIHFQVLTGLHPVAPGERPDPRLDADPCVRRHTHRQRHTVDRAVTGPRACSSDIHVDHVGEGAPATFLRLDRAHARHLEIVEDGVELEVEVGGVAAGKCRAAFDLRRPHVNEGAELPFVGKVLRSGTPGDDGTRSEQRRCGGNDQWLNLAARLHGECPCLLARIHLPRIEIAVRFILP